MCDNLPSAPADDIEICFRLCRKRNVVDFMRKLVELARMTDFVDGKRF